MKKNLPIKTLLLMIILLIFTLAACVSLVPSKKAKLVKREVLDGHSEKVLEVAFNPVTGDLASVGYDEELLLWDIIEGKIKKRVKAHGDQIFTVAFSPDGKLIATGGKDRMIKLWDAETLDRVGVLEGHKKGILSIAFSPDNKLIAASGSDLTIRFWDMETHEVKEILTGHSKEIQKIRFDNTGDTLISGSSDGKIKKWDVDAGLDVQTFKGNIFEVLNLAYLDENRIIGANADSTIILWDAFSGKILKAITAHPNLTTDSGPGYKIWGLDVHRESGIFVTTANDSKLKLWDAENLKILQTLRLSSKAWSLSINREGTILAAGLDSGKIQLYNLQNEGSNQPDL